MAHIRKRGATWYAEVRLKGVHKNETFPTRGEANAWALETERAIRAGKSLFTTKTLEDALMRYVETVSPRKRSAAWERNRALWMCKQDFARRRLDEITPDLLGVWRDERSRVVTGASIRRDFAFLSSVLTTARKEWRWISVNPCNDVARPKDNPGRERRVSDDEVRALYIAAGPNSATMGHRTILCFEFCIETAMRSGEALSLHPGVIVGATAHLPLTKNGDARTVPLSPRALEIMEIVGGSFGLDASSRDALFRKLRNRAGLDDLHFHDSRHEAICRLAKVFDVLDLARITGHRNINQLLTYYHANAHDLALKLAQVGPRPTRLPGVSRTAGKPSRAA